MSHKPYAASYKRRLRRRRAVFLLLLVFVAAAVFYHHKPTPTAATTTPARLTEIPKETPAPFSISPTWPSHVTSAAIGAKGHGVLATHGDLQMHPTASVAKVITTLAILERYPLNVNQQGPSIPITAKDEEIYHNYVNQNGSVAYVLAGHSLTERQALEAMLLPSANNVADTTAIWAFGSLANYKTYANDMVKRFGLTHTVVGSDASGLNPSTQSTASDLVTIGEIALTHPVIAQIVAMQQTSDLPVAGVQPNYNRAVTNHGYTGIKLGESDEAGITLLLSTNTTFKGESVTLVGAVLGAQTAYQPQNSTFNFMESVRQSMK